MSLHHASTLITSNRTPADGHLFLIKHLLILKQQIVAFDIEYVVTPDINIDFSGVTNTFYELRERGGFFDPRNLWKRMGGNLLPKVVENMLDAKVELDGRLRGVITDFTTGAADRITTPINETATGKKGFDPLKAVNQAKVIAEKEVPLLRKKLDKYLNDQQTKETLVSAVQDLVVQRYETFYEGQMREKNGESGSRRASKKGKGREDEVWDVDMFEEWAGGVFMVGKVLGREEEDDDGFSDRGSGTVSF